MVQADTDSPVSQAGPAETAQDVLVRIARILAEWSSLDDLVSALMRLVLSIGGHDRVSVFLWDEDDRCAKAVASAGARPLPVDEKFDYDGMSYGLREAIDARRTAVIDYDALPADETTNARRLGSHLALFAPMQRRGQLVGALMLDDPGLRREFSATQIQVVELVSSHAATAVQNASLVRQLEASIESLTQKDRAIRQAYSDVIDAVTGGGLVIVGRDELDETLLGTTDRTYEIHETRQLAGARRQLADLFGALPWFEDLQLAVCEGLTNMLKHAGGGEWWVLRDESRVQVVLSDSGGGIDFRQLPKATLVPGFSMAQSLGMGFTLMMELVDRILVCTDPGGTTLVLEKDLPRAESQPADIAEILDRGQSKDT